MKTLSKLFLCTVIMFNAVSGVLANGPKTETQLLFFGKNNANISHSMQNSLKSILEKAKIHKIAAIRINGYTDHHQHSIYNDHLSQRRVQVIGSYFLKHGIELEKVRIGAFNKDIDSLMGEEVKNVQNFRLVEIAVEYQYAVPEPFNASATTISVSADEASSVSLDDKGTVLHVPAHCFVDDFGNEVKGPVQLTFKEYTNAAEIAFSGIPMTYKAGYTEYNFNSSGMFELSGSANGKNVNIANDKMIKIDYAIAQQNPDISFFRLRPDQSGWDKIQEIAPMTPAEIEKNKEKAVSKQVETIEEAKQLPQNRMNRKNRNRRNGKSLPANLFNNWMNDKEWFDEWGDGGFVDNGDRTQGTLLAEGINEGHTYPDIVKGLNVKGFGVYNCDQIYRLANKVTINAKYVDKSGNPIDNLYVLSLIDLNYNGAFSFAPGNFTCDAKGKNVLALFTTKGELYMLEAKDFERMNISEGGTHTFVMKNMTAKIKSHQDLATHLGIKL